jgi:hypothetical protein
MERNMLRLSEIVEKMAGHMETLAEVQADAQKLAEERFRQVTEAIAALKESQQQAHDDRIDALIQIVDEWIRGHPRQSEK